MNNPIFIIGNPRSGTTLLRLILDSHPELVVPPECGFLVWWRSKYKDWSVEDSRSKKKLDAVLKDFRTSKKMETWELDFAALSTYILERMPKNYGELGACLYEFYSLKINGEVLRWGDKNNFYIKEIPTIHLIHPEAQFLFITRDGRDVACSYRELNRRDIQSRYAPRLPDDICEIAQEWATNNRKALQDLGKDEIRRHWVRYEDLVSEPEDAVRSICEFLGVEFFHRQLDFFKSSSSGEPKEFLQWKENIRKPIQTTSVGRYKDELTEDQIMRFQEKAGAMLKALGYKLSY